MSGSDTQLGFEDLEPYGASASSLPSQLRALYLQQQQTWPLLQEGVSALQAVQRKRLVCSESAVTVQFNPQRMINTTARVDARSIKDRSCFLCTQALPALQKGWRVGGEYLALCNPRPIFPEHFTISHLRHEEQSLSGREDAFLSLAKELNGEFALFFNGAKAGASAPDHLHFQACPAEGLPLLSKLPPRGMNEKSVRLLDWAGVCYLILEENEAAKAQEAVERLLALIASRGNSNCDLINVIGVYDGFYRLIFVLRAVHRPSCFYAEDNSRLIVSPAAVEMAGVIVTTTAEDFGKMDEKRAAAVMKEVVFPADSVAELEREFYEVPER